MDAYGRGANRAIMNVMRVTLAASLLLAALPARAAFDGMDYRLDPARNVLVGSNARCTIELKEVRVVEVNGLYALSGNTFPYSVFFISSELDEELRPVFSLYGLLGNTYLRDSKGGACRALTTLIARRVTGLRPKPKGSPAWKFSELYEVGFEPGAELSGDKLDAALEAGTKALSDRLDAGR